MGEQPPESGKNSGARGRGMGRMEYVHCYIEKDTKKMAMALAALMGMSLGELIQTGLSVVIETAQSGAYSELGDLGRYCQGRKMAVYLQIADDD